MGHAFRLAQILRAQATRSQVSSRSVVTESINGSRIFPVRKNSKLHRLFQLVRAECSSNVCPKRVRRSPVLPGRGERLIGFLVKWWSRQRGTSWTGGRRKGADSDLPGWHPKETASQLPQRGTLLPAWVLHQGEGPQRPQCVKGKGPMDPGVAAPLAAAGCRGNCFFDTGGRSLASARSSSSSHS